jgi:hypothetical protein
MRQTHGEDGGAEPSIRVGIPMRPICDFAARGDGSRRATTALVKYSRLSVQPVTPEEWKMVCKMGGM